MYSLLSVLTLSIGRNYIDGLGHILGNEVVSTLDGNVQHAQLVKQADSEATTERSYPDGSAWRYDDSNKIILVRDATSLAYVKCIYDGVEYINPIETDNGFLIEGIDGTAGAVYLELGLIISNDYSTGVEIDHGNVTGDAADRVTGGSGNFQFAPPLGTLIDVCLVGGGGAGGSKNFYVGAEKQIAGGGRAGDPKSLNIGALPENVNVPITIGVGGVGVTGGAGGNGTATNIGTYASANGGAGGTIAICANEGAAYQGNGAAKSTCFGNFNDGAAALSSGSTCGYAGYGGGAGLGNGSAGAIGLTVPNTGGRGSGGGGVYSNTLQVPRAGHGGAGFMKLSWVREEQHAEVRKMVLVESLTTGGLVTFDEQFKIGQSGLFYPVVAKTMPLSVDAGAGNLVNEPKRIVSVTARYRDTQAVSVNGIVIPEREFGDEALDRAPILKTGIEKNRHLGYNRETSVIITQNDPMPFTLLSLDIEVNY